jgi:hypothetical protein
VNITISGSSGFQINNGNGNTLINIAGESCTVQATDTWWSTVWLPGTEPGLGTDVVLAGRELAAEALRTALSGDEPIISVGGDLSVMEFKAFLAATLFGSPLAARAFFVAGATALTFAGDAADPPILMMVAGTAPSGLPLTGTHKIVLYGPHAMQANLTVPAVDGNAVAQTLSALTGQRSPQPRLAALARRGLEQLRRALSLYPQYPEAGWAVAPDLMCRRLSLLGEFSVGDSPTLTAFAGLTHDALPDAVGHLLTDPDRPLFGRLGSHWYLQDPLDAFLLLRGRFTAQDLEAFADLAGQVLGGSQPASPVLRRGLARTLVLLAVHGDDLRYGSEARRVSAIAGAVVRRLLTDISIDGWQALVDVIESIAEAAPATFLDRLSRTPEWHTAVFDSERDYPPLLWALELLARSSESFDEAVDALARLAAVYPGGRLSNRPSESLAGVFDCRFPQTGASRRVRKRALRRILETHPSVGRVLLRDLLLPQGRDIRHAAPSPQFRQWPLPDTVSLSEEYQACRDVAALAVDDAGTDPVLCARLVPCINAMPAEDRAVFVQVLTDLPVPDRVPRRELFEALTDLVIHHQQHAEEDWALPQEQVDELAGIARRLRPDNAADRHHWLFAEPYPWRAHGRGITGLELHRARTAAVVEILAEDNGFEALLALAADTGHGDLIGAVLPRQPDEARILSWLGGARDLLAVGYVAAQIRAGTPERRSELLARAGDATRTAALLLASQDPRWALEQLPELDPATAVTYWRGFPTRTFDLDMVAEVAAGLCSVGRFAAALDLIGLCATEIDTAQLARQALLAAEGLVVAGGSDPESDLLSRHHLQKVVDLLARHLDVLDPARVMAVELSFSAELGGLSIRLPVTAELMRQDPAIFAGLVIASRHGATRGSRIAAWHAIRAVDRCPGAAADGSVQFPRLLQWVQQARTRLAQADLQAYGDRILAKILVHAIPGSVEVIGELVEQIRSNDLDRGIADALYNQRGLTVRALTDGGTLERTLATHYDTSLNTPETSLVCNASCGDSPRAT